MSQLRKLLGSSESIIAILVPPATISNQQELFETRVVVFDEARDL